MPLPSAIKELIKYADPSFVMGNFGKDNQENILGIKAVKEELTKPSYATDIKSYKFVSDKYKIFREWKLYLYAAKLQSKKRNFGRILSKCPHYF